MCSHGAWVENKGALLTYHYRAVPSTIADRRDALVKRAVQLFLEHGCHPHHTQMASIEARPPVPWSLGRASLYILRTTYGVDWPERVRVVYAGLRSDENAMETLNGLACTFNVSQPQMSNTTATANYRLSDPDCVLSMLRWIEARLEGRLDQRAVLHPSPVAFAANFFITCIHSELELDETESADDDHHSLTYSSSGEFKRRRRNSKQGYSQTVIKTAATALGRHNFHDFTSITTTVIGH